MSEFRKYDIIDIGDIYTNDPKNKPYCISNSMFECSIVENQFSFVTSAKYTA